MNFFVEVRDMATYTGNSRQTDTNIQGSNNQFKCINSMRLFGLPYQFIHTVDPRIDSVSNRVGNNFVEKIIMDAPCIYIIPGKAQFMPGESGKKKESALRAFLRTSSDDNNATSDLFNLAQQSPDEKIRYYDFVESYSEYMKYVNAMCRAEAAFLELNYTIDGTALTRYDWKNYRWNSDSYTSAAGKQIANLKEVAGAYWNGFKSTFRNIFSSTGGTELDLEGNNPDATRDITNNYIQFYVDPGSTSNQQFGNEASPGMIKSFADQNKDLMKEVAFIGDSSNINISDAIGDVVGDELNEMTSAMSSNSGAFGNIMNQVLSGGKAIVRGENIIIPDIYKSSSYSSSKSYQVHLRAPYGNKFSIYMDVIVPLLHIIGLVAPRQGTGNSYSSPFLVKINYPGVSTCHLGIVESIDVTIPASDDAFSIDGLPMEIDVGIIVKDLYNDMMLSPANDPGLFVNNSSLIDYLANSAGINIVMPSVRQKTAMLAATYSSSVTDIPRNVKSVIGDNIEKSLKGLFQI